MLRLFTAALVATVGFTGHVVAQEEELPSDVTSFGLPFKVIDGTLDLLRKTKRIFNPYPQVDPRYYRLILSIDPGQRGDRWVVQIRGDAGRVLAAFDEATISANCIKPFKCWTRRLVATHLSVELSTTSPSMSVDLVRGVLMPVDVATPFYSAFPGSVSLPLDEIDADAAELSDLYRSADLLGMFVGFGVNAGGEDASWCCSGVRISDELFMTNWHCGAAGENLHDSLYWSKETVGACELGIVDFSWDGDENGREQSCRSVEFADRALDVAILRLGAMADGDRVTRMATERRLSREPVREGQRLTVLHHPACKPKSATRHCLVWNPAVKGWRGSAARTDFTHNCTTEKGSSGAAVFDAETMDIVGIHHLGADAAREKGNFAIRADAVIDSLEAAGETALIAEIVAAGVLTPE